MTKTVKNNKLLLGMLACSTALSACGGGGGGGGGGYTNNPSIYYTSPVHQATVDPLTGSNDGSHVVYDSFVEDIDGDGSADDVIFAGRKSGNQQTAHKSRLSMFSFENGRLVDKTSQWFSGTDNEILGTEPAVDFVDFFKNGRKDMFVSHSTDSPYVPGPGTVFINEGNRFSKVEIPTVGIWSHDSDIGDLNNDGYADIIMLDYGPNSTIALNNQVNGFTTYVDPRGQTGDFRYGGSGVTIGDFMGDGGNNEIIVSDSSCPPSNQVTCVLNGRTKMFGVDFTGGTLTYTWLKDLPIAANALHNDHHVRVVNHDYNEDGTDDVIVFSRPFDYNDEESAIQFLQNDGSGNFTDTTSSTLIGFDTDSHSTYKPTFFDVNGDGKIDIVVSGGDYGGTNDSHQFLLKTQDNKYIASYQTMLTGFLDDAKLAVGHGTADSGGATVTIFKGDDGNKYLVTFISYLPEYTDRKLAIFMSRLDGTPVAAGTAVTMLQTAWPHLSIAQATQALLDTSTSYAGGNIIDLNKAYQPIGNLTMNGLNLNGGVWGFDIGNTTGTAMDGIGRGYTVNLAQTNVQTNGATMYNAVDAFNTVKDGKTTFGADNETQQFTFGHAMYQDDTTTYSVHMSKLNSNPWIGFSGVWGEVTGANIMDNVVTYKAGNFTAKGSVMHVSTDFNSGLITEVSDQVGAWGEVSYSSGGLKVDAGVHPVILNGDVKATIPTSIDMRGNLQYTDHKFSLPTQVNGYLKGTYNFNLDTNTKLQVASAVSQSGNANASINYSYSW